VSIWHTQEVHDAATRVLLLHHAAKTATHALVEVYIAGFGTTAALMKKNGDWQIDRLYTADREMPGAVGVVVVGIWG
jgi:hypothetical protein